MRSKIRNCIIVVGAGLFVGSMALNIPRKNGVIEVTSPEMHVQENIVEHNSRTAGVSEDLMELLEEDTDFDIGTVEKRETNQVTSAFAIQKPSYYNTYDVFDEKTMYVTATGLNIREEPSSDSDIVTVVGLGTAVNVTGDVNINSIDGDVVDTWSIVTYGDKSGYVKSKYIEDNTPLISLGVFDITYYCPCAKCCDIANRQTASGAWPKEGVTIAADPSIPFGTELVIDGHVYTVQDRGGMIKGNHVDIFMHDHQTALSQKRRYTEVYMKIN